MLCLVLFPEALFVCSKCFTSVSASSFVLLENSCSIWSLGRFKFNTLHAVLTHFRLYCRFTHIGFHKRRHFEEYFNHFCPYNETQRCSKQQWTPLTFIVCTTTTRTFIFQNAFFCVQRKKVIQIWNDLGVSKRWQNFHFWGIYPFTWLIMIEIWGFWLDIMARVSDHSKFSTAAVSQESRSL